MGTSKPHANSPAARNGAAGDGHAARAGNGVGRRLCFRSDNRRHCGVGGEQKNVPRRVARQAGNGGIALAIIPVITGLGTKLKTTFSTISTALK
jgi:hypothetical protein